jgi:integrase
MRHHNNGLRKLCDHPRRAWAKCDCPWHFNFKWKDRHYRFSLDKHLDTHLDSKSAAEDAAHDIRRAIKAGTFGQPVAREDLTLRRLADTYVERYVDVQRAATKPEYLYALNTICRTVVPRPTGGSAPLGDWRVGDIVTDTIERFREIRSGQGTGVVGVNRNVRQLRALFNWAIRVGYVETTPFKRGSEPVVKLAQEPKRGRRLQEGEDTALLAAAGPLLRAVIEAALETGMRRGEILSLQWKQIEGMQIKPAKRAGHLPTVTWTPRAEIVLPWTKTKTRRDRRIPISTRLRGILEMRRFDPAKQPHESAAFVFGSEIGTRVRNVKRAWNTAVLKAHKVTPVYTDTANLDAASRQALAAIDLHFHDLRREAGSRWLDGGVPLHTIRDWLGHTSIAQTSTYLAGTMATQHDAMKRFEAHQAASQQLATKGGTGGKTRPRSAVRRNEARKEDAVGREPAIM